MVLRWLEYNQVHIDELPNLTSVFAKIVLSDDTIHLELTNRAFMSVFLRTKKGFMMKYVAFCGWPLIFFFAAFGVPLFSRADDPLQATRTIDM